jgi:hypothetical protein
LEFDVAVYAEAFKVPVLLRNARKYSSGMTRHGADVSLMGVPSATATVTGTSILPATRTASRR